MEGRAAPLLLQACRIGLLYPRQRACLLSYNNNRQQPHRQQATYKYRPYIPWKPTLPAYHPYSAPFCNCYVLLLYPCCFSSATSYYCCTRSMILLQLLLLCSRSLYIRTYILVHSEYTGTHIWRTGIFAILRCCLVYTAGCLTRERKEKRVHTKVWERRCLFFSQLLAAHDILYARIA